jgi:catechol 2,3-dioxygenase-like lactoylglutathione lyase family enzyme
MSYQVKMMFHPSHRVPDLQEADAFFNRVFGRECKMMYELIPREVAEATPDYPRDYCTFTLIQDVFFDTIDPKRYVIDGEQRYPTVTEPYLRSFGWYVDGLADLYPVLRENGIRCFDQLNVIGDDDPPRSAGGAGLLYWAVPEDAGLSYEFFPAERPFPGDERAKADWHLPPISPDDPLGIERCSHHTVLTRDLERALKLVVTVLGGEVIGERENQNPASESTFVHLAGSTLEYVVPQGDSPLVQAMERNLPQDTYHSITWKVANLDTAAGHLQSAGVQLQTRRDDLIVTDPATSLGIPWGFTTSLIPEDPRARQ